MLKAPEHEEIELYSSGADLEISKQFSSHSRLFPVSFFVLLWY